MSEDSSFELVVGYGLAEYLADLLSGDVVVNFRAIVQQNYDGTVVGSIPSGTKHYVLNGQKDYPGHVWLGMHEPIRERHTWDLNDFWETFETTAEKHKFTHGDF